MTRRCAPCGMPREDWSDPQLDAKGHSAYCCAGCAQGEECVCPDLAPAESLEDQERAINPNRSTRCS